MVFKFGLDSVLKHRKRLEEVAQREFAEAQAAVDAVLARLEEMYKRMDEVREEIQSIQLSNRADKIEQIRGMEFFINGQKARIEQVRQEARTLLQVAEAKQEDLIYAAREKKVLVKLKEKRWAEYREWRERIEAKMMDDQSMMARAWGKR